MSYQTGWMQEVARADGRKSFKVYWRERNASGEWVVKSKTLPPEINGKPTVRKDAQQELNNILRGVNERNGVSLATSTFTFESFLGKHWDDYVTRNKLRGSTLAGYSSILENWMKPFFGSMPMIGITKHTVTDFFKHLRDEGLSAQSQKNIFGLLNKLFELAVAFDVIAITPVNKMLHRPHVEHGEKRTLPVENVRGLFEALPEAWRVPFAVLLLTGMRQGELLGLRWQDIDFDAKLIYKRNVVDRGKLVEGLKQTRHTGRVRKHIIGMPDMIKTLLESHRAHSQFANSECFVFCREDGSPLDPDHMRRYVLYPAMEKAGIKLVARESGLHMFRHTVVSEVARRLGLKSAQDQAGHSDIGTTADTYTHINDEQKLETAKALQEAFATHLLPSIPSSQLSH